MAKKENKKSITVFDEIIPSSTSDTTEISEIDSIKDVFLIGTVTNCFRLNIRKQPDINSDIVAVVNLLDSIKVYEEKSTKDWCYVSDNDGNSGYCMREYVVIKY